MSPTLAARFLTTGPSGKSLNTCYKKHTHKKNVQLDFLKQESKMIWFIYCKMGVGDVSRVCFPGGLKGELCGPAESR